MIGIALVAVGEFFAEIGTSVGKYEESRKKESLYAMGFLNFIWATVFFILIAFLWRGEFVFSMKSLPTFIARAMLEVTLLFINLNAIITTDRSTFSFLRVISLPLLLVVDVILGYYISPIKMIGFSVIIFALLLLIINHSLGPKGKMLSLFSAILPVGTISLYKYNITHFNSVEAEQAIMHVILLFAIVIAAKIRMKENVFKTLTNKVFIFQSLMSGMSAIFISFAYLFSPASIITAAKRVVEILASIISGQSFFHEKKLGIKISVFALITIGIVLILI